MDYIVLQFPICYLVYTQNLKYSLLLVLYMYMCMDVPRTIRPIFGQNLR